MNCPACQVPMVKGASVIQASWVSLLFLGFSHMNLYFESGGERRKIMGPDEEVEGYRCPECGSLFLRKSKEE